MSRPAYKKEAWHIAMRLLLAALAIAPPVPQVHGGQDDENLHCDLQRNPND